MKLCRLLVVIVGVTCQYLAQSAVAETCDGSEISIPDGVALPSVQSLAKTGDSRAQAQLGAAYLRGVGVERDIGKALSLLEKSAVAGDSKGQYLLGQHFIVNGKTDEIFKKAVSLLQQSADNGCIPAIFYLGLSNYHGKGTPKNIKAGLQLVTKAAEAGYTTAQVWLGAILITGEGVSKDFKAGFKWTKKAADAGDSAAQITLANLYLTGIGTLSNPEKTVSLLESVYAKEDQYAATVAFSLGWMHMEGKGVPVNKVKALGWMIIAANDSVSDSEQRLKTLTKQLPKQKLSTACSVYMDPLFDTNKAKEYVHANSGEIVIMLSEQTIKSMVYFPERALVGFIFQRCLTR